MPRTQAARPPAVMVEPPIRANSMIASAASLTRDAMKPPRKGTSREWQGEAWRFYDSVGELRQAAAYIGKALSRITLNVKQRTSDGVSTLTTGLAVDALAGLFEGETGRSQMMETLGVHLTVPGESYIVAEPSTGGAPDTWMVLSNDEIRPSANVWAYDRGEGKTDLSANALVMRVWRPHARKWIEADSSVRAILPVLREVEQLSKHIAATADSRLAGAGVFMVPSEMTFASPPSDSAIPADPLIDPFLAALAEAMLKPIENRGSAAAVVPMVVRAPGEVLEYAKHISFSTPFDDRVSELLEGAIKRCALGMDLPPEIMLGQGDANHWSAWQIDESALKIHVEPLCELITDAFTRKWLWPILESEGEPDYTTFIGWDTSDLRVRPNHATEAVELYDRGELSADALRRETGFDESDKPDDEEREQILLLKLVQANNDLTVPAAAALGLPVGAGVDSGNRYQPVPPPEIETPVGRDRDLPEREESRAASAQLAALEMVVLRALERANNRVNRRGKQPKVCSIAECDQALVGAWEHVPHLAAKLGLQSDWLQTRLDSYARDVLSGRCEHSAERLAQHLIGPRGGVLIG